MFNTKKFKALAAEVTQQAHDLLFSIRPDPKAEGELLYNLFNETIADWNGKPKTEWGRHFLERYKRKSSFCSSFGVCDIAAIAISYNKEFCDQGIVRFFDLGREMITRSNKLSHYLETICFLNPSSKRIIVDLALRGGLMLRQEQNAVPSAKDLRVHSVLAIESTLRCVETGYKLSVERYDELMAILKSLNGDVSHEMESQIGNLDPKRVIPPNACVLLRHDAQIPAPRP